MASTRRRMNRSSKAKSSSSKAAMANIMSRLKSTNKSIAAAIGGRRTRKQRASIPKSVAMRNELEGLLKKIQKLLPPLP